MACAEGSPHERQLEAESANAPDERAVHGRMVQGPCRQFCFRLVRFGLPAGPTRSMA